jgi:hypothetical protein
VSLHSTAQAVYAALGDDPQAMAKIRNERAALALSIATDPNAGLTITSATVNGQSFSANDRGGITGLQRLTMLSIICRFDDIGQSAPAEAHPYFS